MTIHDEIDNYLAADLHNELSEEERRSFTLIWSSARPAERLIKKTKS